MRRGERSDQGMPGYPWSVYTSGARVDCSPPTSFFECPRSVHYKPFAQRQQREARSKTFSFSDLVNWQSRRDAERVHIERSLSRRSLLDDGASIPPRRAVTATPSRLSSMRCYHRPTRASSSHEGKRENEVEALTQIFPTEARRQSAAKEGFTAVRREQTSRERVDLFKDTLFNEIIARGVFTDSVIKESLSRHASGNHFLSMVELQKAAFEVLNELGIVNCDDQKGRRRIVTQGANKEESVCEKREAQAEASKPDADEPKDVSEVESLNGDVGTSKSAESDAEGNKDVLSDHSSRSSGSDSSRSSSSDSSSSQSSSSSAAADRVKEEGIDGEEVTSANSSSSSRSSSPSTDSVSTASR